MKIIVAMRQLADLVEELEVNANGDDIDRDFVKFVANEWDEAALEEALCIKDESGAEVCVVALDEPEVDQSLFTALAKGADRAVKLTGHDPQKWIRSPERAEKLAKWIAAESPDLVLTGVQAADDLDGQLAALLAARLGYPHAAVVVSLNVGSTECEITQELGGGFTAISKVTLPAVMGIQAARQAPRYAPISRIRNAMQTMSIEEVEQSGAEDQTLFQVNRLYPPESRTGATMLDGSATEVANQIVELIKSKGLI